MNFFTPSDEGVKKFIENELFFYFNSYFFNPSTKIFFNNFLYFRATIGIEDEKKKEKKKKLKSEEKII